ncbi:MAG: hypothetical protein MK098_12675 [Marinovum sp.]|nr:hypothetical protein [Marinovum sp.]
MTRRRKEAELIPDEVIERQLAMPICGKTAEETGAEAVFRSGRDMARQGDWAEVAALMVVHDRARDMTPDGTPLAELLSAGARSDLVLSLQRAARSGVLSPRHYSIECLEEFCAEVTEDVSGDYAGYGTAILLSETLMDAGWAWYEQGTMLSSPDRNLTMFTELFGRAAKQIEPFSALEENAPALAATNCALLAGNPDASRRILDEYEDLIDLNPAAPGHQRAFGLHLMPQWFGNYALLEVQALKVAAQTQDLWGAGGYTWVWLDVLALDPAGFAYLDLEYFLDGIDDILSRRSSQHFVNLFAAFISRYLVHNGDGPDRGQRKALVHRRASLIRGRMRELHPWVWGSSPLIGAVGRHRPDRERSASFRDGRDLARLALADVFASELSSASIRTSHPA